MRSKTMPKFYCKRCNGDGGWIDFHEDMEVFFNCTDCNGTGMLTSKTKQDGKESSRVKSNHTSASTDFNGNTNHAQK